MWASITKFVGAKVLSAILAVGVIGAAIYFWRNPDDLAAIWSSIKGAIAWLGFVIVLPWATFFVPVGVIKKESNRAAAGLLLGYLAVDAISAYWLAEWSFSNTLTWFVAVIGILAAGVYNYAVCDFIAERVDSAI
jgi:hypothetical protein